MERRNANYKLLEALKPFEVIPHVGDAIDGTHAGIRSFFEPSYGTKEKGIWDGKYFYEVISAPMLLARLCAGFHGLSIEAAGQEWYKITWQTAIRHKSTGAIVSFYDFKGSASFGGGEESSREFKRDVKALLLALTDERFPHPYDGCVVGEVA